MRIIPINFFFFKTEYYPDCITILCHLLHVKFNFLVNNECENNFINRCKNDILNLIIIYKLKKKINKITESKI